jgi:dipeptidyl aminopeptidase/acylaminoacyl peptidase/predicted Ser/Thr protein kinase
MSDRPPTLGPYPVERELGRGGMGVVYLARDPRLERSVAIKVLPDAFARDPERLARFEREARILASLNHPNIAGIHGVEESDGQRLLVLEYVPGETLAARTERGALALDEALDVCRQIASAVEAAHEGGVIHRDLKPGNVRITPEGAVKVLDFGLAKGEPASAPASGSDLSHSPTLTYAATAAGVILGTAAYMSPEQARGRAVDKRTDIWSFGCVLYECLTGRQVFEGETVSDMIAKILQGEPDWARLPTQTPARIRDLLHRCLEKDARKRLRDIGDARLELEEAIAARSTATRAAAAAAESRTQATRSVGTLAMAVLLLVVGAGVGIGLWNLVGPARRGGPSERLHLSVAIPPGIRAVQAAITPDGRTAVILGRARGPDGTEEPLWRLYRRRLDGFGLEPIPGTEGVQGFVLSPDGRWVAFVAVLSEQSSQMRLVKAPIDGSSPPVALADWDVSWSTALCWLEGGDILAATTAGKQFVRIPSGGGAPKPAVEFATGGLSGFNGMANRLPGDRGVLLRAESWGAHGYQNDVRLLDPGTGKVRALIENAGNPIYSPAQHLLFFSRGDALMAVPFDLHRLAVTGGVLALMDGVRTPNSWDNGSFDVSGDGTLVYPPGGRVGTQRTLVVVDAAGNQTPFAPERRGFETSPALSRDGRKAAVVVANAKGTYETWVADLDRPGLKRVLSLPAADCATPVWSPDGRRLAFSRTASDSADGIYAQPVDGSEAPRPILRPGSAVVFVSASSWAPDGSGLLVSRISGGKSDMLFVPLGPTGEPASPRVLLATPYSEGAGRFSPDGRLIAFVSDESGKNEIYVAPYRADGTLGPRVMVSSGGGVHPCWAGDSRRLFFSHDPYQLMSVTVSALPSLSASAPVVVHNLRKLRTGNQVFDVLPDGRLFIIQNGEEEDDITQFNVVLGWFDEVKGRMAKARGAR